MYPYLPLKIIKKYEKIADLYNVARVCRGIDKSNKTDFGFLEIYKIYKSHNKLLNIMATKNTSWHHYRINNIKAKLSQMKKNNIPLYSNDKPTKMHVILIMWGYSPDKKLYSTI